ncbi:MAG: OmpH family outer membrane protein [Candidatus Omnitrophota bacterium]|nr:MAG: OmpH family outer membrane protein [Candidatus Omnitrophota bacterium]
MHKKFVGILIIVFCLALSEYAFAEGLKIGYINMRKVFYEYKKTKKFNEELEKEDAKVKEEIENRTQEVRKFRDEMGLLSETARKKKEPEMIRKVKELDEFRKEKLDGVLRKKEEMFREIRSDILDVSEEHSKKNGYDVVFDEALFVYSLKKYDITDDIIKRLNK